MNTKSDLETGTEDDNIPQSTVEAIRRVLADPPVPATDAVAERGTLQSPRFTLEDANRANDEWGANCGPAALAVVCGMTLEEVRPHMGDFESKRYTNPLLMFDSLRRTQVSWRQVRDPHSIYRTWPEHGLARVQWEGPWTAPGVPMRVRYRHTHWVAAMAVDGEERRIFDVNCMCVGGWVPLTEWVFKVVPWLLKEAEPKANGFWHLTHVIEVARRAA